MENAGRVFSSEFDDLSSVVKWNFEEDYYLELHKNLQIFPQSYLSIYIYGIFFLQMFIECFFLFSIQRINFPVKFVYKRYILIVMTNLKSI